MDDPNLPDVVLQAILMEDDDGSDSDNHNDEGNYSFVRFYFRFRPYNFFKNFILVAAQLHILIDIDCWKRLCDPAFQEHFRMDRTTFDVSYKSELSGKCGYLCLPVISLILFFLCRCCFLLLATI
jgi:hypothetical protein